jgi:hypothetical protein
VICLSASERSATMTSEPIWRVEVAFTEDDDKTRADAVLDLPDAHFHGFGQARRAPGDPSVPMIGEELAAARALSDLTHQLVHAAAARIERFEGRAPDVHL